MAVTAKDLEWARGQIEQYIHVFPLYDRYARILKNVLIRISNKCATDAIVQTRPKSISSFAEKIWRKKHKYSNPVNQITDLCGGRIITNTLSKHDAVCKFIKGKGYFDIDWDNSIDTSQRMKPTEFGYRSSHFVVQFKKKREKNQDFFPNEDIDIQIPEELFKLKAEIQVRTLLGHAWAIFSHDRSYKSTFTIPKKWKRELAGLASTLESADNAFTRIHAGLQTYAASYGAYMTNQQMHDEIKKLELALEYAPENVEIAYRIGKLAITLGDWKKAIDVLSKHVDSAYQPVLRDLGVAKCKLVSEQAGKLHKDEQKRALFRQDSPEYRQGQKYLEAASAPPNEDADALASLAGTWKGIDEDKVRKLYRQAFEIDPSDPYSLSNCLEYEIAHEQDISLVSMMRHMIDTAIQKCRDQSDVGVNLPWAFYDKGKFYLLLRKPRKSLAAYAKAVQLSTDDWMIETSIRSLDNLAVVRDELPGFELARRLLLVGRATRFPADSRARAFTGFRGSKVAPDIREIIAQSMHENYRRLRSKSALSKDPSMIEWDRLPDDLKDSNRQQADHIFEMLHQMGCKVNRVTDRDFAHAKFTEREIEIMAEKEHARWVVERLLKGWEWGKNKDVLKKTSPYLVPWSELPDDMKELDRATMRKIPEILAEVGIEVCRE